MANARPSQPVALSIDGSMFHADLHVFHDLAIPQDFDGAQPRWFDAPPARSAALSSGGFSGRVERGASCNCSTLTLTPHCDGTHTECAGHLTREPLEVRAVAPAGLVPALLVSVTPVPAGSCAESTLPAPDAGDLLITAAALAQALAGAAAVRTTRAHRAHAAEFRPQAHARLPQRARRFPEPAGRSADGRARHRAPGARCALRGSRLRRRAAERASRVLWPASGQRCARRGGPAAVHDHRARLHRRRRGGRLLSAGPAAAGARRRRAALAPAAVPGARRHERRRTEAGEPRTGRCARRRR